MASSCSALLDKSLDVLAFVIWSFPCRGLHNLVSKNTPFWTRPSRPSQKIWRAVSVKSLKHQIVSRFDANGSSICRAYWGFLISLEQCWLPRFQKFSLPPNKFLECSQISSNTCHCTWTTRCWLVLQVWSRLKIQGISTFIGTSIDVWHGAGGAVFDERLPFYKHRRRPIIYLCRSLC